MRRLFAILLICLLPLQSFAGLVMSEKMASMEAAMSQMQMADAAQAPCHEASQSVQVANHDCCGSQAVCQMLCQMTVALPVRVAFANVRFSQSFLHIAATAFQSADLRLMVRPPHFVIF